MSEYIMLGATDAEGLLWDDASQHHLSKRTACGGYKDMDTGATAAACPAIPFRYLCADACRAEVYVGGVFWVQSEILPGGAGEQSGTLPGLPQAANSIQGTAIGSAGVKAFTVYLKVFGATRATDTGAWTMFDPAVVISAPAASATVPDCFDLTMAWSEYYTTAAGEDAAVVVKVVVSGTEYPTSDATEGWHGTVGETMRIDLATLSELGINGLPAGAFILRVKPVGPFAVTNVSLTHTQTYDIAITSPIAASELVAACPAASFTIAQGWDSASPLTNGSIVRLSAYNGLSWRTLGQLAHEDTGAAWYQSGPTDPGYQYASPRIHRLGQFLSSEVGTLIAGDSALRVEWGTIADLIYGTLSVLASDEIAITVPGGSPPGGGTWPPTPPGPPVIPTPTYPPWVRWDYPPEGSVVGATFTAYVSYGNYQTTAAGHLRIVAVGASDTLVLYDGTIPITSAGTTLALPLTLTGPPADGEYACYVDLSGVPGEIATTRGLVTLDAGGTGLDTTPPTCSILSPADGATVSGTVDVIVAAADDVSLWRVSLSLDAQHTSDLFAPNDGVNFKFAADVSQLANGSHTISAGACDSSQNASELDTITVTVANTMADATGYFFTPQMGTDVAGVPLNDASGNWSSRLKSRFIIVPDLPAAADLPTDPRYRYNLFFGRNVPGTSVDWHDFTITDPYKSFKVTPTRTIKGAMCAIPEELSASWDITATSLLKFATASNGDPLILALTPHSIQRFSLASGGVTAFADLSDLPADPVDFAAVGGKVFVAAGDYVYAYDEVAGRLLQRLQFWPDVLASVDALATDGTSLYIAATLDATGSRLYKYTFAAPEAVCDHAETITTMAWMQDMLWVGNANGDILTLGTNSLSVAYATGEASVTRFGLNGSVPYAGTGGAGKVFAKVGAWGQRWDSGFTAVTGLASFNGYAWAGGSGTGARYLWYEKTSDNWVQSLDTDSSVTAIGDMMMVEDTNAKQQLLAAATRSGGTCRLYRYELAPSSPWQCGVDVPAFVLKAV